MNEVNPFRSDDALKTAHVERQRERVLGRRGVAMKRPPIACNSPASSSESVATSARAPVSASAAVTASVSRSSPPAATGGTICRIVRPASGASAPRPKGERASTAHGGPRLEHESVTGARLTCSECSAKSAPQRAPMPGLSRRVGGWRHQKRAKRVGRTAAGLHRREAPNNGVSPFAAVRQCATAARSGLAQRLSLRHGIDQGECARRRSRAARPRPAAIRLFRPWLLGGAAQGRHHLPWLEETLALVRAQSEGPQILLGSSMGGYLSLLAARA